MQSKYTLLVLRFMAFDCLQHRKHYFQLILQFVSVTEIYSFQGFLYKQRAYELLLFFFFQEQR